MNTMRVTNGLDSDQDQDQVCKGYLQATKIDAIPVSRGHGGKDKKRTAICRPYVDQRRSCNVKMTSPCHLHIASQRKEEYLEAFFMFCFFNF